jgi:hypothetical protein
VVSSSEFYVHVPARNDESDRLGGGDDDKERNEVVENIAVKREMIPPQLLRA